ncbi:MAG: MFS transporter [Pseudomonadota bacterium]
MIADPPAESRASYAGWKVVAGSAAGLAFGPSTIAVLSLGLFMRSFEAEFGWSRTQVSIATTIVAFMIVVVSPLQGWLIDRYGARPVILCSIPAFAIGVAGISQLPAVLPIYYLAWVLIPILGVGIFPLSYLRATSSWFQRRLGLALGLANSGVAIGSILIPVIVTYLIQNYGWRQAYMGLSAIVLLFTLPIAWRLVYERDHEQAGTGSEGGSGATFGEIVRTRTYRLLCGAFLLIGVTATALIVHQIPLLIDAGMSPTKAASVQVVFGIFGLIGRLVTGVLLDHLRATRVMVGFILGGAMACGLYAAGTGAETAFVCSALTGLLFGAEFDVLAYVIKKRFGMRSFGKSYGFVFAMFQFGSGCGAALLPMMRDRFGSYSSGLALFTVLLLSAAIIFAFIRDVPVVRSSSEVRA